MKRLIENIPLLTICFLYFGFCNLYYYYNEFKIDIYTYISNSEIILSFFPVIVLTASLSYFFLNQMVIQTLYPQTNSVKPINESSTIEEPLKESKFKRLSKDGSIVIIIYIFLSSIIEVGLINIFDLKSYNLQWYEIITAVIFCLLLLYYISKHNNLQIIKDRPIFFSLFFIIYIGTQINSYRKNDALKIKDGIPIKNVCFKYNNSIISTSNTLLYVGQTQSNIFLYNRANLSTIILGLSKVDSLVVK